MFAHILCATDLSPRSDEALRVAVQMAARYESRLTLLNIHEEFMDKNEMAMLRVSVEQMQERFREIAVKAKAQMRQLVVDVGMENVKEEYLIREGKSSDTIVKVAHEFSAKLPELKSMLLVMGTNGRKGLTEHILGSVAEHVIRHAPCPVLVIPYGTL